VFANYSQSRIAAMVSIAAIVLCSLLITGRNPPELLYTVDGSFYSVPFPVNLSVKLTSVSLIAVMSLFSKPTSQQET
jgi:hypothetical protein